MIVMTLSYTKKTGDQSLIKAYVRSRPTTPYHITERRLQTELLDQWAQFLVTDALIPANQISTDDFAGQLVRICIYSNDPEVDMYATFFQVNQTNLAIKGIIGIQAMSEIWSIFGQRQHGQEVQRDCGFVHSSVAGIRHCGERRSLNFVGEYRSLIVRKISVN
jgi:hypothetical protein